MTRRVLVSHKLPPLRSGNAEIDRWVEQHLQAHVSQVFDQLVYCTPEEDEFTAEIAGDGTAGTYEIAAQTSRYCRVGDKVTAWIDITMAAALTAGGTGNLVISGLPYLKVAGHLAVGAAFLSGVDIAANVVQVVAMPISRATATDSLVLYEVNDNGAETAVPISAIAANDTIVVTITYTAE